jgi:hypothetical protein
MREEEGVRVLIICMRGWIEKSRMTDDAHDLFLLVSVTIMHLVSVVYVVFGGTLASV